MIEDINIKVSEARANQHAVGETTAATLQKVVTSI